MRLTALAAGVLVLSLTPTGLLAQRQLSLVATVVDPSGAEVGTVEAKDIRVTENDVAATILKVEPVQRVPKVQLLIDNGIGLGPSSLSDLRNGVRGFLEALPPDIEVTIITTAPQPRTLQAATNDRAKLLESVGRLSPDSGAGRFVESLHEATTRIERDKDPNASYTIVAFGTSSGDTNVRDRDIRQVMERIQKRRTTVHVVLLTTVGNSASGGIVQGELGQAAAQATGGRFQQLAVANRVATLLPEIGSQIAAATGGGSTQIRVTIERPGGASGDLGKLGMGVAGKTLSSVIIEQD